MTIKEIRTICNMTQQQFSKHFGIPKRTIEDWETGKRKPPNYIIEFLKKIIEYEKNLSE